MTIDGEHILADEGKVFRRIGTNDVYGNEMYLGYSYYINGVLQDPPHLDVPTDFEEIDAPEPEPEPEPPVEPEISDSEALRIITEG